MLCILPEVGLNTTTRSVISSIDATFHLLIGTLVRIRVLKGVLLVFRTVKDSAAQWVIGLIWCTLFVIADLLMENSTQSV